MSRRPPRSTLTYTPFPYTTLFRSVDWTWAPEPWSAVFAPRDDGVLLSLTYKREHQVVAWARQTTAGDYENTATVAEDGYHGTYFIVEREVGGALVRYLERFDDPQDDYRESAMLDAMLTYDGRDQATTVTISGGGTPDTLATVIASGPAFVASNVG